MKWTDEDIDKLFQDAAGKADVPYQESYWEEMEALLPAKSKKKPFWWIFGVFFALIGFATTFYLMQPKDNQVDRLARASSQKVQGVENNKTEQNEVVVEQTAAVNSSASEADHSDNKTTSESQDEQALLSNAFAQSQNVNTLRTAAQAEGPAARSSQGVEAQTGNQQPAQTKTNKKNTNPQHNTRSATSNELNTQGANALAVSGRETSLDSNGKPIAKNTNGVAVKESTKTQLTAHEQTVNVSEKAGAGEVLEKNSEEKHALALKEAEVKSASELEQPEQVAETVEAVVEEKVSTLPEIGQAANTSSYYIQAGMRFSQSFLKTSSNQLMTGVNLGIGYQKIKPGFGYSIGLHATSSFVNNMEIIRRSRVYGFGVTNYEQSLKYKQLTYLELPISLNYMRLKNTFSVGVAPTYLVSTLLNFTETSQSEVLNQRNYYGQKIGLKTIGLEAMLGYRRTLKNNWSVGINIGMMVINQIDGDQFEHNAVSFPLNGQLTLRKTLIPKR